MRKYAFIRNNVVLLLDSIEESDYDKHIRDWDSIIDVEYLDVQPEVGWLLVGNTLLPASPEIQQAKQQLFGAALCLEVVNKMGARNIALSHSGSTVNVASLVGALSTIKNLLETGALKTARAVIQSQEPSYPDYSDIFRETAAHITTFLQSNGWD